MEFLIVDKHSGPLHAIKMSSFYFKINVNEDAYYADSQNILIDIFLINIPLANFSVISY